MVISTAMLLNSCAEVSLWYNVALTADSCTTLIYNNALFADVFATLALALQRRFFVGGDVVMRMRVDAHCATDSARQWLAQLSEDLSIQCRQAVAKVGLS
jgi:hypothetical protein